MSLRRGGGVSSGGEFRSGVWEGGRGFLTCVCEVGVVIFVEFLAWLGGIEFFVFDFFELNHGGRWGGE